MRTSIGAKTYLSRKFNFALVEGLIVNVFASLRIFFVETKCELQEGVAQVRILSVGILRTTNCRPNLQEPTVSIF